MLRPMSPCLMMLLLVAGAASTITAAAAEPIRIADRWELLVDRHLIEQTQGAVELRLHEPVPQEVVLVHDKPWEGNSCGYHTIFQDGPILTQGAFDSQNLAFWDTIRQEYRCYFRDFREGRRDIKVSISADFLHWTQAAWLQFPDAPEEHLYTNAILPYDRAPHLFLGFPTRYLPQRSSLTEGLFMSSRDGRAFQRWPEAFIRPGLNSDKWHNRSNYIWWGLVETSSPLPGGGKELSLYTNEGYYFESKAAKTRRYTCRLDGFVSLHASLAGGEILTKPLVFEGGKLIVNFSTSAAGALQVQIEASDGRPVAGFAFADCPEIYGDATEHTVTWKQGSDVSTLAGKPIRLRILLRDADLYAFGFRGRSN